MVNHVLTDRLGFASFCLGQLNASVAAIAGNDVVVKMTTSAGKFLCYILPFLCLDGVTVVVSPLMSLMEEQVSHSLLCQLECFIDNSHSG